MSEQCSQNNFPIIKKTFQSNKIKKMNGVYLGQSGEDKSICNYFLYAIKSSELFFSLCFVVLALKNKNLSVDSVIVFIFIPSLLIQV